MKNSNLGPIIYVEDDIDDRLLFKEMMNTIGVTNELLFFDNGKHFLEFINATEEQPLLIFCDINMPIMSGIELRRIILADKKLKKNSIPFVFYTTSISPKEVELAYDLTVQGYFQKSANLSEMKATLKMIYDYWCVCKHPNSI